MDQLAAERTIKAPAKTNYEGATTVYTSEPHNLKAAKRTLEPRN